MSGCDPVDGAPGHSAEAQYLCVYKFSACGRSRAPIASATRTPRRKGRPGELELKATTGCPHSGAPIRCQPKATRVDHLLGTYMLRAREENRTPNLLIKRYRALNAVRPRYRPTNCRSLGERCASSYPLCPTARIHNDAERLSGPSSYPSSTISRSGRNPGWSVHPPGRLSR